MQTATAGGSDGRGPKKPSYSGFWLWAQEMTRLDAWPRMDEAFQGRALERSSEARDELSDALDAARKGGSKQ